MAPGGYNLGITTLDQNGTAGLSEDDYLRYNDYYAFAGTSASAPIVTGVVAQLLEANPTLTRLQVYNALQCSADKIGDVPYIDGRNDYYGYGKINANAALKLVR
ncbi:S8 family serine peptidase, partial [Hydrogenimonas sp.]